MRRALFFSTALLCACSKLTAPPPPEPIASDTPVTAASAPAMPTRAPLPPPTPTASAAPSAPLKSEDIVVGKGPAVHPGDLVKILYTGTLLDGTKFDSSADHGGKPLETTIPGHVIQGWNQGVLGMRVGGKRKLTVPPELGYGSRAAGKIPPNSTLVFNLELVDVKPTGNH